MPFYEFECPCGIVEIRLPMSQAGYTPHCDEGHSLVRVWSMPNISTPDPGGADFMNRVASGDIDERDLHGMDKETARKTALGMAHAQKNPKEDKTTPTGAGIDKFYT